MKHRTPRPIARFSRLMLLLLLVTVSAAANEAPSLEGLWKAYQRFDTYQAGPVLLDFQSGKAQLAGQRAQIISEGERWHIEFPSAYGSFNGRHDAGNIKGHWLQPGPKQQGMRMATPVQFTRLGDGRWRGTFTPMPSQFTFYLPITRGENGTLNTFMRNPERNLGIYTRLKRVERDGNDLKFVGTFFRGKEEQLLASGHYNPEFDSFTLALPPWRGGSYNFYREDPGAASDFYARPPGAGPWHYQQPPALADGWPVGTLEAARIDEAPIREMIDKVIAQTATDVHALDVHGVLIARGGRLVLEEYFYGFSRDMPHDTRSAGKSLASMLVGAVMEQGTKLSPDTPVYAALEEDLSKLDERKRTMTLEHLLSMSSGFYCDDSDSDAPGNEDTMQSQEAQPDWYRYTLDLPMADEPGSNPVYCSANSNLIGAVISASTGRPLKELVQDLIAGPLQIERYYLDLQPSGELYLGGGSYWLPRDYMKLAQVMLGGGIWNGKRIVSEEWAKKSTSEAVRLGSRGYAWQWWVSKYDWHGNKVNAYFAAGNGGQIFMSIPAADLVIAFWGGNYSDATLYKAQNELIPNYILPAVKP